MHTFSHEAVVFLFAALGVSADGFHPQLLPTTTILEQRLLFCASYAFTRTFDPKLTALA